MTMSRFSRARDGLVVKGETFTREKTHYAVRRVFSNKYEAIELDTWNIEIRVVSRALRNTRAEARLDAIIDGKNRQDIKSFTVEEV